MRLAHWLVMIAIIGSLGLAGCGVKGPLDPPPGEKNEAGAPDQSNEKPHRGFVLDGLLD